MHSLFPVFVFQGVECIIGVFFGVDQAEAPPSTCGMVGLGGSPLRALCRAGGGRGAVAGGGLNTFIFFEVSRVEHCVRAESRRARLMC